ncbi:MAG: hypothetical protein CL696_04805 [Chloroflexi bacterium]|nr:hypothetical protein [Chloroflexota bacterium]
MLTKVAASRVSPMKPPKLSGGSPVNTSGPLVTMDPLGVQITCLAGIAGCAFTRNHGEQADQCQYHPGPA